MLTRLLFSSLAIVALALLSAERPAGIPRSELIELQLFQGGILVLAVGVAVPWGRWIAVSSPGGDLAFLTRLLGWCGVGFLPLCLETRSWIAAGVGATVSVAALALWKGQAWAAWPWYLIGLGGLAHAIHVLALVVLVGMRPAGPDEGVFGYFQDAALYAWILFWGWTGVVLLREITRWRRARAPAPSPAPAG